MSRSASVCFPRRHTFYIFNLFVSTITGRQGGKKFKQFLLHNKTYMPGILRITVPEAALQMCMSCFCNPNNAGVVLLPTGLLDFPKQ